MHCLAPGAQVPAHAPPLQTFWQGVPFCQVPFGPQSCGVRSLHCRAPGEHTPTHAPDTHVWLLHAAAAPHWPAEPQVCTLLPVHCELPGTHTPAHVPPTHADETQVTGLSQVPEALQVWIPLLESTALAPGVHTPTHEPFEHA